MIENRVLSVRSAAYWLGLGVDSIRIAIWRGAIKTRYIASYGETEITLLDCSDVRSQWAKRSESRWALSRLQELEDDSFTMATAERKFTVLGGLVTKVDLGAEEGEA